MKCKKGVRGIFINDGRVLLGQRTNKTFHCPNCWEFPGGKTDCQNSKKALIREVKEETGLRATKLKKMETRKIGKYTIDYFMGQVDGKIKIQTSELQGIGWFEPNEVRKLNLSEQTRRLI